jgi:hypothetical protein
MSISGSNFQFDAPASDDIYYLSRYPHIWGWATWRRAWSHYDAELSAWPSLRGGDWLRETLDDENAVAYWSHILELTYAGLEAWDRAWVFACWLRNAVSVTPNVNLVSNIGFREDATHTGPELASVFGALPTEPMRFPLRHPSSVDANASADAYIERLVFGGNISRMFERLRTARRAERTAH